MVALVLLAYQQIWRAGFIWDDDFHVTRNLMLRDLRGLWRIWSDPSATPQYYPLVHTSFWLEYQLWGLQPLGYHLDNLIFHGFAAILLWRVLVRLELPGAWLAAALFAVHPVEVESVAWITERKNVLSGLFYLAAALYYLRFLNVRASRPARDRAVWYSIALALFVCALLSKTVACSLPAALLLVLWWKNGRLAWSDARPLLPFFLVGIALGLNTVWLEVHHVGANGAAFSLTWPQRILIAGRAVWFYAAKIFWPANLTFIYPRWHVDARALWQWLFPLAAVALLGALWFQRRRLGRGPLVATLFFIGTLAPALGFLNVFPFRYSFVADHFQYLASIGLIVPAAFLLSRVPIAIAVVIISALGGLTWAQAGIYESLETLWRDTLTKNPRSWMVQNSYGGVLFAQGKFDEALRFYQRAEQLEPVNIENSNNMGSVLLALGRPREALPYLRRAEEILPVRAAVHYNLGAALSSIGRTDEALQEYRRTLELDKTYAPAHAGISSILMKQQRLEEALSHLDQAVALEPDDLTTQTFRIYTLTRLGRFDEAQPLLDAIIKVRTADPSAMQNLAWILSTCPDARLRDGRMALALAEHASEKDPNSPSMKGTLAAAYAECGRFDDAIRITRSALVAAQEAGDSDLVAFCTSALSLYQAHQPFRDVR